ncbi:hypothetical protein [Ligilactobacillus salivarius]|uniref:hypothetical protein n=1 Tax=Ligilactobacillus salivarius TaxID=1624 RepID=UPI002151BD3C|nr:hypothetical protein [Ligilactobacillus salivarius]MDH4960925.1 hypothetical protein [Ligilactobacillus salivarius]UUY24167.1 hypothetical protein NUU06_04290 [Ligilactobacillus salivarius]
MSKVLTNESSASEMKDWALDPNRKVKQDTKPEVVAKAKVLIPDDDDPIIDMKTGKRRTDDERRQQVQLNRKRRLQPVLKCSLTSTKLRGAIA